MNLSSGVNIAVLVSGGGTNLQALIDAEKCGELGVGRLALVVSSSGNAYALKRAEQSGIKTAVVSKASYADNNAWDEALLQTLKLSGIELVILAGYLSIVGEKVLKSYPERIINVHPSLIPSFCGDGFYGLKVHEAAIKYGVKITGATVHFVSEIVDGGKIILQKAVNIMENDTAESLQRRVMEEAEWQLLPKAAAMLSEEISNAKRSCDHE